MLFRSIKTNQKRCTYSSANKRIVSVSSKGIIKARGVGDAVVKVESKESGDSRRIRIKVVKKPKVNTYLSISKKSYTIKVGDSKTIGIKKITSKTTDFVRFSSKNKKIVTVDAYGTIIGKKKGNTKIVVSCGKKSKSVTVKIK